jgi:hypothetical protein
VRRGGEKNSLAARRFVFYFISPLFQQGSTSHSERNIFENNEPDGNRRQNKPRGFRSFSIFRERRGYSLNG